MKIITDFKINLEDMSASKQKRHFTVVGDSGAVFSLEVKNEDGYYYNFNTETFSATKARLNKKRISNNNYRGYITFPTIGDNDQYDIYLWAENADDTFHSEYTEVRFNDGSLDLNSSIGSNSSLLQKVIYQYTDTTITLSAQSPNSAAVFGSMAVTDATIVVPRGQKMAPLPFSIVVTAATTKAFRIINQPTINDITAFGTRVINTAVDIKGEDIYPEERAAFTGDDVNGAITSGAVVRMDNTDLSAVIEVGDKITSPVTTDTVNGDFSGGATAITMDAAVATKMAVGDMVTGTAALDAGIFLVDSIDSTNVFSLSASAAIDDGTTLTFSSKVNRSVTTVTVVETSSTATDFTMSQAIQFRDNQPLVFSPRKNYRWSLEGTDDPGVVGLTQGMKALGTNVTTDSIISPYEDTTTYTTTGSDGFGGVIETTKTVVNESADAIDTLANKPTITNSVVTAQLGNITFNNQQKLLLAGDTIKLYAYGPNAIKSLHNSEIELTNLNIALTKPTTTTTEATSAHATIAVADREGVINDISTVSGIGINPSVANPTLTTGGGLDGAGDWIMDAVQTLESGITLTVENTSRVATITGRLAVTSVNDTDFTLRFDLEHLLSA